VRVFDAAATRLLLPAAPLLEALRQAMRAERAGSLHAPLRMALPLPDGGSYLVMAAADAELAVTKQVTVHPSNWSRGLPTIQGHMLVRDALDGGALMALDGPTVTARRTAALSALGLRNLASRPARSVALVGTGVQALEHARLLAELGGLEALHLVGRTPARAEAMAATLARELGDVELHVHATVASAACAAQAIITLTTSACPVLPDSMREDLLVIGVGAFRPQLAELPPALLRSRRIVVDTLEGARAEAGDLIQADLDWTRVTEMVDRLDGPLPADGAAPVFKTVGTAAWDLAAAHVARRVMSGG
jgi:1-piperideine-2-carboxylate/1-pyrroline-2-carboxylate reductase [NAD(P)H]